MKDWAQVGVQIHKMSLIRLFVTPRSLVFSFRSNLSVLLSRRFCYTCILPTKEASKTAIRGLGRAVLRSAFSTEDSQEPTILRDGEVHPDRRTIFIGKMNLTTTEETLKQYLSEYGDIEEVKVVKRSLKNPCAFVVFKDASSVKKVLEQPHVVDLRLLRTEKYKKHQVRERKVYVGIRSPLAHELSERDIRGHFSQFGTVESVDFIYEFESRKRKNFCFVAFSSEDDVVKALQDQTQQIGRHSIEVRKSTARGRDFLPGKIMLEDLPVDITAEHIQEYFLKFGDLLHIDMVFYRAGNEPRDFAFVTFTDSKAVEQLTRQEGTHIINGKAVNVHKAVSRFEAKDRDHKVFVECVPPETNMESIEKYFGTFGTVKQVHLVESWLKKHNSQCGILTFTNSAGVHNAMSSSGHMLDGCVIKVRRLGLTGQHKSYLPISS